MSCFSSILLRAKFVRSWCCSLASLDGLLVSRIRRLTSSHRLQRRLAAIKSHEELGGRDPLVLMFDNHLETGFQLATFQGPLCAEPMEGMAYFVESLSLDKDGIEQEQGVYDRFYL